MTTVSGYVSCLPWEKMARETNEIVNVERKGNQPEKENFKNAPGLALPAPSTTLGKGKCTTDSNLQKGTTY